MILNLELTRLHIHEVLKRNAICFQWYRFNWMGFDFNCTGKGKHILVNMSNFHFLQRVKCLYIYNWMLATGIHSCEDVKSLL